MSARRIVGLILVVIGIVALLTGGIRWTREKTVLDTGSIEIKAEEHQRIPLPPILGAVALIGGIVLLGAAERRPARAKRQGEGGPVPPGTPPRSPPTCRVDTPGAEGGQVKREH